VRSNAAPRIEVILQLAQSASFDLEIEEVEPDALTLRIEDAELERALPALLGAVPYRLAYDFDPVLGRHVLARLRIGAGESASRPTGEAGRVRASGPRREPTQSRGRIPATARAEDRQPPGSGDPLLERLEARGAVPSPDRRGEIEADLRDRLMLPGPLENQVVAGLENPNPLARSEALEEIDPEGPGRDVLLDYLEADPDPRVRAAAAEQLSMTDSFKAVRGLVGALYDPDSRVVLKAVEALDLLGDESLIPELAALRNHGDPAVREAVAEALEALE
jgi:hypothetical protein